MALFYIHMDGMLMATRFSEQEKQDEIAKLRARFPRAKVTVITHVIEE